MFSSSPFLFTYKILHLNVLENKKKKKRISKKRWTTYHFIFFFFPPVFLGLHIECRGNCDDEFSFSSIFDTCHRLSVRDGTNASNNITFLNNSVSCPYLKVFMLLSKVSPGKTSHAYFFLFMRCCLTFLQRTSPILFILLFTYVLPARSPRFPSFDIFIFYFFRIFS